MNFNKNHVGVAVGTVYGIVYLAWSLLVATGLMQGLLDWAFEIHFLDNPFEIEAFSFLNALILVVLKFIMGYVLGWIAASVFNGMSRAKERVNETM